MLKETIILLINIFIVTLGWQCSLPSDDYRLDCFPEADANENDCQARGCCWSAPNLSKRFNDKRKLRDSTGVPYCYYPTDFPNYQTKSLIKTNRGFKATLSKQKSSFLPNEILNLNFEVIYETKSRIRIRITDPNSQRFEVPIKLGEPDPSPPTNPEYKIFISSNNSFSFEVVRKSDGLSLYKTFGPLLYSDQFIQISSYMATHQAYGIGEQNRPFLHDLTVKWTRIGLWARDFAIENNINLYGTHPFYVGMPDNGHAFGVYYFNSNAQEFDLQPAPAITYRTTGGILDIFIFTGGTPDQSVKQYLDLIGKPMLPPFWSLGFHLSRWGYTNLSHVSSILQRNLKANMPIDVQWSDIDYMDIYRDFTYNPINYTNMGGFVTELRQRYGIRYVTIIDPGISNQYPGTYAPYDDGLQMNVFIRDHTTNKPLIGNVWPGDTVFPDFTHPNALQYWSKQIQSFYKSVPVDGLWIDMNEPSNFYDGSKSGCPGNSSYDNPFFTPAIRDNSLVKKTICPSALHYNDIPHYNLHNLYGYTEALITNQALLATIPQKRVFILSRSTFSGSGKYTFHWTGDNTADWDHLANSIRQILNFNMFGIPMVGADICGFNGDSNEELCVRWMQLGSFYPFMRNHNTIGARDQDPAAWSKTAQGIMSRSLRIRYILLPYFYTLFVKSNLYGETVMRPLSFEFYSDHETHAIDLQFMIGSSILVSPVVKQGATSVVAYFPAGVWYDLDILNVIYTGSTGKWLTLEAPLSTINVALRGGHIITMSPPSMNTDLTRKNNFILYCPLSLNHTASGDLYWDDGESMDSYTNKKYTYILFTANLTSLNIMPVYIGYNPTPAISYIMVAGLTQKSISSVTLNGKSIEFTFDNKKGILVAMTGISQTVGTVKIQWN